MHKFLFGLLLFAACDRPHFKYPEVKTLTGPCYRVTKSVCDNGKCRVNLKPIETIFKQFDDEHDFFPDDPRRITIDFLAVKGDMVCKMRDVYSNGQIFENWELLFEEQPL